MPREPETELRYSRCVPALSEAELAVLKTRKAAVIGCGGLGGFILTMLARNGIGALSFADPDRFEESNLNRQIFATVETLGKGKAFEAERRLREINPGTRLEAHACAFSEETADQILDGCDIVLDALDSGSARRALAGACAERGLVLVHGAVSEWCAQVCTVPPGSGILEMLYPEGSEERRVSSLPFLPPFCASLQVSEAVRYLAGRECALMGKLLSFDAETMTAQTVVLWDGRGAGEGF